eukprot:scaffold41210_cov66-Phaeocystis_antarctica.AAC.4
MYCAQYSSVSRPNSAARSAMCSSVGSCAAIAGCAIMTCNVLVVTKCLVLDHWRTAAVSITRVKADRTFGGSMEQCWSDHEALRPQGVVRRLTHLTHEGAVVVQEVPEIAGVAGTDVAAGRCKHTLATRQIGPESRRKGKPELGDRGGQPCAADGPEPVLDANDRVVLQMSPHSGQLHVLPNAGRAKLLGWPDARAQ